MAGSGATPMTPKKRPIDRHHYTRRHPGSLGLAVYWDNALKEGGEFVGECARVGALDVVPVIDGQVDLLNAYLQDVARQSAIDKNRTGQNVRTGPAIRDLSADRSHVFRNRARRNDARSIDDGRIESCHRLNSDDVTRIHGQHRLQHCPKYPT
jgi:hypothetical protein